MSDALKNYQPFANKFLNADGTITTLEELLGGTAETAKTYFFAASDSTISVPTDEDEPSFLTDMNMIKNSGFILDATDGKIQNTSGREISMMRGTISFQPDKGSGGTTTFHMWGERSTDGINWTANEGSLRSMEFANSGETFKTSLSLIRDWKVGEYVRFRFYSSNSIEFVVPSIVSNGVTITGHSVMWELKEA